MRLLTLSALLCAIFSSTSMQAAHAADKISDGVVKVGVMTDMSGPYSNVARQGSVVVAKMAIEDLD